MGLIDDKIRSVAKAALDSLMAPEEEGGLGKRCRLLFDPLSRPCPNCVWDGSAKRSTGRPRRDAEFPFPAGTPCPVCEGRGLLETERSREIVLSCNWTPREWTRFPGVDLSDPELRVPGGAVQTKGKIADLPDVLACRGLVVDSALESSLRRWTYVLAGEPISPGNILQRTYWVALWKRTAGGGARP